MRIQGIVLAVFALTTTAYADEALQRDARTFVVRSDVHEQPTAPYQLKWQRRLIEVQTAFAATLGNPIDRVETGSITHSDQ